MEYFKNITLKCTCNELYQSAETSVSEALPLLFLENTGGGEDHSLSSKEVSVKEMSLELQVSMLGSLQKGNQVESLRDINSALLKQPREKRSNIFKGNWLFKHNKYTTQGVKGAFVIEIIQWKHQPKP